VSFVHEIRVRYGEVDRQGVVFNAHWLAYVDDAFTRFLAHVGFGVEAIDRHGFDAMVVHAELDWRGAATFEDRVGLEVGIARLGASSFDLCCVCRVAGRIVVVAQLTYVAVTPGGNRAVAIPAAVRRAFARHPLVAPDPDGRRAAQAAAVAVAEVAEAASVPGSP
jgi:acyl-CoA thioester hydrolase